MEIQVTIKATITVPDGSTWGQPDTGRQITLPNGDWVKPFVVLELNDDHDLTFTECTALGCDVWDEYCDYA